MTSGDNYPQTVSFGDLSIDYLGRTAYLRGHRLELTRTQYDILAYLTIHPGQVVTREDLRTHIWGENSFQDENNLAVHVHRLRTALEEQEREPIFIETCRGIGYKFTRQPDTVETHHTLLSGRDTAFDRLNRQARNDTVLVLLDGKGEVDWVSNSIQHVLGWAPQAVIGMPFQTFTHRDDSHRLVTATGLTRASDLGPVRWRTANGTHRPLLLTRRVIPDASGNTVGALDHWFPVKETTPQFQDGQARQ